MIMWKDVLGYKGLYKVNSKGDVLSFHRKKSILLKHAVDKDGYEFVTLSKTKETKIFKVHRLVAINFIQNPKRKLEVNHINGIKTDNRVINLEWCTCKENHNHAFKLGLRNNKGSNSPVSKLTEKEVLEIRSLHKGTKITQRKLAIKFNVHFGTISDIVNRKKWKHI